MVSAPAGTGSWEDVLGCSVMVEVGSDEVGAVWHPMKSQLERTSAIADMLGFRLLVTIAERNTSWSSLVPDGLRIWVTDEEKT